MKEKEICGLVFPSSTKREIRHFHAIVVVQWRLRKLRKSVMHVKRCCFVNLNLLPFCCSRSRRLLCCLNSLFACRGSCRNNAIPRSPREKLFKTVAILLLLVDRRNILFVYRSVKGKHFHVDSYKVFKCTIGQKTETYICFARFKEQKLLLKTGNLSHQNWPCHIL